VPNFRYILPNPDDGYRGATGAFWFLVALNILVTVRSLIHLIAPDGGANSIAGLDVDGAQGDNLISIFSTWGLSQLLMALVTWAVIIRYRFLVPFMLVMNLFDWAGRLAIAQWKPLVADDAAPGEIGNYIFTPLCLIALWFALPKAGDRDARSETPVGAA